MLRVLISKAHILIVSLVLSSLALSGVPATTSAPAQKAGQQKPQTITRLATSPRTATSGQSAHAYVSTPSNSSSRPVEAQNETLPPDQSTDNPPVQAAPPAMPPTPPPTVAPTCTPCGVDSGCPGDCAITYPTPTPPPSYGCGSCGQPLPYGRHPMIMCPINCAQMATN